MPLKAFDPADEPEINMTPMIDCVFLLLIFFMVGTKFIDQERDIDVKLPSAASAAALTSGPDDLIVNIVSKTSVVVSGEAMSLDQLEEHLKTAKKNFADQGVLVRGSGAEPYQFVMNVLDVCERSQISKVSLAHRIQDTK